ncbi:MAG: ADP-forming succinate--CoA ligase subunit beta [Acidobacteria bacterium]|nr:MAG: ADP-forming succinate--CoA ligase subunit beta [Acidobacteriota bacterium]
MKIHEYQAKSILKQFGVKVPEGKVVQTAEEAYEVTRKFGPPVAVKAQIHAGGRGKGGGIKLVKSPEEAETAARRMLGSKLVTPQTGPEGRQVRRLLIEKGQSIKKEYYLGIVIDRSQEKPVIMASSEGGVEIEEVASRSPELILKVHVDPCVGFLSFQGRQLGFGLGLDGKLAGRFGQFVVGLYDAFRGTDASLAEINPLILTTDGEFLALDAKMNFDDNALFRHPEIAEFRDFEEEEPLEIQASRFGLNYIKLDGNVGCMVNGAGLAMATMDIIKLWGGSPANFLDVGGGASTEQVRNAFKILVADQSVKAVLINIFGGIMRCDMVANGVVQAIKDVGVNIPMVVRLEGTNVEEGREVLRNSGLNFQLASGMADAAEKVCAAAK